MWRKAYNIRWTVLDDILCLCAKYDDTPFMLPPFGLEKNNIAAALEKMIGYFEEHGWLVIIKGAEKFMVEELSGIKPDYFDITSDRDNFDYIYLVQDLIELRGRKFHVKKNHSNHFKRSYSNYQYLQITSENAAGCIDMAAAWYQERLDEDLHLEFEQDAVNEVLNNWDVLSLTGGVLMLGNQIVAFSFGEQLNEDTAVIHVEKANTSFRGCYAVINQEYCRNSFSHLRYINREEDMGIPGLRVAKESYNPIKMVEKYVLTRRA
jgi:hypothetical protein